MTSVWQFPNVRHPYMLTTLCLLLAKHLSYKMATEMLQDDVYTALHWLTNNGAASTQKTRLLHSHCPLKTTVVNMFFTCMSRTVFLVNVRLLHTWIALNIFEYLCIVTYLGNITYCMFKTEVNGVVVV